MRLTNISILLAMYTAFASTIDERTAADIVKELDLIPNIEKGYYRQTFQDPTNVNNRSVSTAIYYLLEGSVGASYWHRVDAVEIWHHYAGAPLRLDLSWNNGTATQTPILGKDIFGGQQSQIAIGRYQWQRAQSLGDWTLVGTTVAPGFVESGFEIKEDGWEPNDGDYATSSPPR